MKTITNLTDRELDDVLSGSDYSIKGMAIYELIRRAKITDEERKKKEVDDLFKKIVLPMF